MDSVGVAPSTSIVQTVIPFDDFLTVALALANHNAGNQPATITIKIFDDKNTPAGTATQVLANNQHVAKFLYQFFPGVTLAKGRVEIQSSRQIIGTALTFVGNQASALPFLPSMKVYNYTIAFVGRTFTGKISIAVGGPFASAYAVDETGGAPPSGFEQFGGVLKDGNLEVYVRANRGTPNDLIFFGQIAGFNPTQNTLSGPITAYFVSPPGAAGTGTITLTATN